MHIKITTNVEDQEPRRFLRSCYFIYFAPAVAVLIRDVVMAGIMTGAMFDSDFSISSVIGGPLAFLLTLLPGLAHVVVLAGAGLAIRLVLPIIAEYKTLA